MPVPSLFELAKRRVLQNAARIDDVGIASYRLIRPMLMKVESPEQMERLETNSPQLRGETEEIWMKFIRRDIPNYEQRPYRPRDPAKWSKVYRRLKKNAEREQKAQEELLRQQMLALQEKKKANTAEILDPTVGYYQGRKFVKALAPGERARGLHKRPAKLPPKLKIMSHTATSYTPRDRDAEDTAFRAKRAAELAEAAKEKERAAAKARADREKARAALLNPTRVTANRISASPARAPATSVLQRPQSRAAVPAPRKAVEPVSKAHVPSVPKRTQPGATIAPSQKTPTPAKGVAKSPAPAGATRGVKRRRPETNVFVQKKPRIG